MLAIALALIVTTLAACSRGDDDPQPIAPDTTAAPSTTPPTTPPTATTLDVAALDTSSDDFDRVMRNIVAIRHEAYARPDPALIDLIFDTSCECHKIERQWVIDLLEKRERYVDAGVKVLRVEKIGELGPNTAVVRQIDETGPELVMDANGQVRKVEEGRPPTRWVFYLGKVGGRWKVFRIENEGRQS